MNNKILLDTNAFKRMFESKHQPLSKLIANAEIVYISTIVLAELLAGYRLGSKEKENRNTLRLFIKTFSTYLLPVSQKTAELYAHVFEDLSKKGKPIPTNDLWIAAQTLEVNTTLVTYDKHFLNIKGIKVWSS